MIALFNKLGFQFPKEHGFTVILLYSTLIGTSLSFVHGIDWFSYSLVLLFVASTFFSNAAIMELVKSKFRSIHIFPPLLVIILSMIIFFNNFNMQNLFTFSILAGFFFVWIIINLINRGHTTQELLTGTFSLTLFIPLIYLNSTNQYILSESDFIWLFAIWWLASGFTAYMILYVQLVRKKITLGKYVLSWLIFLSSLLPFYLFSILSPITSIVLIEPSFFTLKLLYYKKEIPAHPKFKMIGRLLTLKLTLFIVLLTVSIII